MIKRKDLSKSFKQKNLWHNNVWQIHHGFLKSRKSEPNHIFKIIAEKLPIESLTAVENYFKKAGLPRKGIYIAHDSMGYSRYVGLGGIFYRLKTRYRAHSREIQYYSFYVVTDTTHQRELETLLIRIASPLLEFNSQKKRNTIEVGSVRDYSPGTVFLQRKPVRRKKSKKRKRRPHH